MNSQLIQVERLEHESIQEDDELVLKLIWAKKFTYVLKKMIAWEWGKILSQFTVWFKN